jgi:hypothetical protein
MQMSRPRLNSVLEMVSKPGLEVEREPGVAFWDVEEQEKKKELLVEW